MRAMVRQDAVRRLDQEASQGHLVAHCARQNKQTGLLASQLGHMSLEILRSGILIKDVVSKGAVGDGCQHGRRGDRHDIAYE